jgi:Flp pilus assembly protein TadB
MSHLHISPRLVALVAALLAFLAVPLAVGGVLTVENAVVAGALLIGVSALNWHRYRRQRARGEGRSLPSED